MAAVKVNITDTTETSQRKAELPDEVELKRLLPALLRVLGLPLLDRNYQPISYRLYHQGQQVGQDQSLAQAGVHDGSTLILSQEAIAGGLA